jgi:hypothetical protein
MFAWTFSYGTMFFSLITNQPTVLLAMTYQPSEQAIASTTCREKFIKY